MANVTFPNFPLSTSNEVTSAIWKLTRALKKAGWTYKASSNVTLDITGVATADKWGGNADPALDTYSTLDSGSWWAAQGPSTVKIPIGASVPSGSGFVRGEKITQATSAAEGEILGVVTDTGTSLGFLVVAPRVGTFDGTNLITGATSSATVTPSTTPITYIRNVVFWVYSATEGHIYYQTIDPVGETSSNLFNATRLANVTTTACPGAENNGSNSWPTVGTYAVLGYGGAGTVSSSYKSWTNATPSPLTYGLAQIMTANNTPATGVSADGSFTFAVGTPGNGAGSYVGFAFLRLDDIEDGDLDPYIWFAPNGTQPFAGSATYNTSHITQATRLLHSDFFAGGLTVTTMNYQNYGGGVSYRGWRRRGLGTGDAFQEFVGMSLCVENINGDWTYSTYGNNIYLPPMEQNPGSPESAATVVGTYKIREPIWIISFQNNQKIRKGTIRWWYLVQGGGGNDTYDSKKYMQLSSTARRPVIAGPWDGSTIPSNQ